MNLRRVLVVAALSLRGIGLLAPLGIPRRVFASKASKRDYAYQGEPKDGKRCATCRQFTPSTSGPGACAIVEGDVSANGWCMAYSSRDAR